MKLKMIVSSFALLAMTIPLTVLSARADFNEDFESYSQNLQARIYGGRASGRLNDSEYNDLMKNWNQIEAVRRQYGNRTPNPMERTTMMNSLLNLDKHVTTNLNDSQFSRYQYWDFGRNDWKSDWQNRLRTILPIAGSGSNYNAEIDAYQRNLQGRLEMGKSTGRLTPNEFRKLNDQYNRIEQAQREYRSNGFNVWERNNLMGLLTNLDRDITAQLNDNDQSRYQYWNADNNDWRQQWWLSGGASTAVNVPANVGGQDAELDAYSWDLRSRLNQGRQSGRITQSEYSNISNQLDTFDQRQWQSRFQGLSSSERNSLMNMLVNIDRNLTAQLHDNDRSKFQFWNTNNNSWSNQWWLGNLQGNAVNNGYDDEINAYKSSIQSRLNSGRSSGRLTPNEYSRLNNDFGQFERTYSQYRGSGINSWERNALMGMLTRLDRDLVGQLNDKENSHYQNWNPNNMSWGQQWWKNNNQRPAGGPWATRDNDRDRDNDRNNDGRPDHGRPGQNWGRDNDNNNWNRGNNNNNNWNRGRDDDARRNAEKLEAEKREAFAKQQAAREQAARDAAAREQAARDQANRDRLAREQAARDQAAKDQAARDAARQDFRNRVNDRREANDQQRNDDNQGRGRGRWGRGNDDGNNNNNNVNPSNNNPNNNDDNSRGRGRRGRGD